MNKNSTRTLRLFTMASVVIAIVIGALRNTGAGTLSAFGVGNIAAVCPLGYLETALSGRDVMPRLLLSFLMTAGLTALLGRVFCGWICPIPMVRKLLVNRIDEGQKSNADSYCQGERSQPNEETEATKAVPNRANTAAGRNSSSGLVILGVTLGSAAIYGFPVFCLICPVGLVFATLFALIRLVGFNEPTIDLVIFPAIVVIELVLLPRWCSKLCPLGALLTFFSRFNRRLVPVVDYSLCLEERQAGTCQRCRSVCSFDVDIKNGRGAGNISDCTKCRECADHCPAHAIRFPWR